MLGLIYIVIVAKPISVRRLSLLFVITLVTARCVYGVTQVANPPSVALATASALTALAWLTPLARAVVRSVKSRQLVLDALDAASAVVRITYGSALVALLLVALQPIANPMHPFTLAMLLPNLVVGGLIGLVSLNGMRSPDVTRSSAMSCTTWPRNVCAKWATTKAISCHHRESVSARSCVNGARTRQIPFGSSTKSRDVSTCSSKRSSTNASTAGRIGSIASSANESLRWWSAWRMPKVG